MKYTLEALLERCKAILQISAAVNSRHDFLSPETARSPRAAGDALQSLATKGFETSFGNWRGEYSIEFGRRALTYMAFADVQKIYSATDT